MKKYRKRKFCLSLFKYYFSKQRNYKNIWRILFFPLSNIIYGKGQRIKHDVNARDPPRHDDGRASRSGHFYISRSAYSLFIELKQSVLLEEGKIPNLLSENVTRVHVRTNHLTNWAVTVLQTTVLKLTICVENKY